VMEMREVVATGLGLITPLGGNVEESWRNLMKDASGIVDGARYGLAGVGLAPVYTNEERRYIEFALRVAYEALEDAGLTDNEFYDENRVGVVFSSSKGGLVALEGACEALLSEGIVTSFYDMFYPNIPASYIAAEFNFKGPALAVLAACATGLASIIVGAEMIAEGRADCVVAGASESCLSPFLASAYRRLGVLAEGDRPENLCRPYDSRRCGFVLAEGAGCIVLESKQHALKRGANIYAEYLGGVLSCDPSHPVGMDASGGAVAHLLEKIFYRAGISAGEVDYINPHGTGTKLNDISEARGIRQALGGLWEKVPVSSQKGAIGHTLGASGAVETVIMLVAMGKGLFPHTRNLQTPDPECELNHIIGSPLKLDCHVGIKLSYGFGGHMAGAAFRRWEGYV